MATSEYLPTIGLEIHAELNTKTKMFCCSKNDASEKRPNINVCPVCMAHPGTLPVINSEAVRQVLRVGAALGAKLADYTEFDRKNYFYPDLPKGYQLSQFEYPLVSGGALNGVKLTRIHLEEDTASSIHDESSGATLVDYNRAGVPLMELVTEPVLHSAEEAGNFGRELQLLLRYLGASEADMEKGQMRLEANISVAKIVNTNAISDTKDAIERSAAEANEYLEESRVNTHKVVTKSENTAGSFEAANAATDRAYESRISLEVSSENQDSALTSTSTHAPGAMLAQTSRDADMPSSSKQILSSPDESVDLTKLGTKVEVKNINSFRAMERAIHYEVKRQIALLERGEKVVQETRGWDENKQATFSQRVKEGSADYRYFPDPDLPSLRLSELNLTLEKMRETLPELPWQKRGRLEAFGINRQDIELYVKDPLFGDFFETVTTELRTDPATVKLASNYIANDLVKLVSDIRDADTRDTKMHHIVPISASNFAKIIKLVSAKQISSRSAKELLQICLDGTSDPHTVATERNLLQADTTAQIGATVTKVILDNPSVVADVKAGKVAAVEYLVGQCMKALRGAADAQTLRNEIRSQIEK